MNILAGSIFTLVGLVILLASSGLAARWRRRDERKASPRRDLDWSQSLDASIFRFLGVSLIVVGILLLTSIIEV